MKYLSLFSGIGGFELGIQQAYESHNEYAHLGKESKSKERPQGRKRAIDKHRTLVRNRNRATPLCVGYSEIDKYAIQIYEKHFPEHKNFGDIRTIDESTLPDFDLLVGGFPCQSFSIAGKRGGFDDTRGTLFFEIARILAHKRPRLVLLENVKGLLSHDNGKTFARILEVLTDIGYELQWQVLNSKNHGVPQNRERVFIVGHSRGTPRPKVFPIGKNSRPDIVLPTLTARYYGGQANGGYIGNKPKQIIGGSQGNRVYDTSGTSTTLASQADGLGAKTGLYAVPLKFLERNQKNYQGDYSFTLDSAQTGGIMKDMKIRRLTPIECERLQGFPDNWTGG